MALAVVGPTLQDLRVHFNVSLPAVSYIFTGRSVGYMLGSILGGVTFEYFHPLLLIAVTLAMSGIGLLITPYCHQFMASVFAISFVGVAMGALDTGNLMSKELTMTQIMLIAVMSQKQLSMMGSILL